MDFALNEDQSLLKESARRFASEAGKDAATVWRGVSEMGWLGLMFPESLGGIGFSMLEAAILLEELGRGLVKSPLLSSGVVCSALISRCESFAAQASLASEMIAGDKILALASEEPGARYRNSHVATSARRGNKDYVLSGRKTVVLDGADVTSFVIPAREFGEVADRRGIGLFLVEATSPRLDMWKRQTLDGREVAELVLDRVEVASELRLSEPDVAYDLVAEAVDFAAVGAMAEALGAMEASTELTAAYLKTRRQFGRAIGEFQVLQHRMADMFLAVESARSMLYRALSQLDASPTERARAVSAAKVAVSQAGVFVGQQAIQLHGGVGMSQEHAVGQYYKRLQVNAKLFGDPTYHLGRLTRATIGASQGEA